MTDPRRLAVRAPEMLRDLFIRGDWIIREVDEEARHFDFIVQRGDHRVAIDCKSVMGSRTIGVSQAKYPPDDSWALAVLWELQGETIELVVPGSSWQNPSGPVRAAQNESNSRDPEWCLDVHPRNRSDLERFRWPRTETGWAFHRIQPAAQIERRLLAELQMARADRPEGRGFKFPDFFPQVILDGSYPKQPFSKVNSILLQHFTKAAHKKGLTAVQAIEWYMAWLLGVDCPDTRYPIPGVNPELEQMAAAGQGLPSYWTDRPPQPSTRKAKAQPAGKKKR